MTPCTAKKICLETSFTSLQSPSCEQSHPALPSSITPTAMLGTTSSKASSVADSLFGRSQLSSILQYDVSSMGDGPLSDTPTVIHNTDGRSTGRSVAFNDELISPHLPRGILHRNGMNGSAKTHHQIRKPTSLAVNGKRSQSDVSRKIDLVHDDWYGMAPLASPETLSEISSISSRASLVNTFTSSIEKYLQRVTFYPPATSGNHMQLKDDSDSEQEVTVMAEQTQMHTPVIMRRTPKIAGNLSGCADDWRSVDTYKRMGKVFITPARRTPSKSDSSEQSFESANSYKHERKCGGDQGSKSADNLDEPDSGEILSASKLTWSDSAILAESCSSRCPNCPCRVRPSADCCQQLDHSFCRRVTTTKTNGFTRQTAASGSSDATFHSAQSSISQFGATSSPRRCFRQDIADGVLESHFPVYHSPHTIPSMLPQYHSNETSSLLDDIVSKHASSASPSPRAKPPRRKDLVAAAVAGRAAAAAATASSTNRWTDDDDDDSQRCFSRNESLPLLSKKLAASLTARGLSSKRNRKQVYPILSSYSRNASPVHRQTISSSSSSVASTKGGESSV